MAITNNLLVYVPSLGREGKQYTLNYVPKEWEDRVFLVCPKNEKHEWKNRLDVPEQCIGSISKTRQWIIDNSPSNYVGQMDDDLTFFKRDEKQLTKRNKVDSCGEMLTLMEKWLVEGDVYCGVSNSFMSHMNPTEYFFGKPSHSLFINKEYLSIQNIRYDDIDYFEDFHVALAVLESGKRLRYSGEHIVREKKANAAGGCSITRNSERNKNAMLELYRLHNKYIKLKQESGATNQNVVVDMKMSIFFKKAYDENVEGNNLAKLFD